MNDAELRALFDAAEKKLEAAIASGQLIPVPDAPGWVMTPPPPKPTE